MRAAVYSLFMLLCLTSAAIAGEDENRYEFDKSHTNILFFISHLGFSDTVGRFAEYNGGFIFNPAAPEKSSVAITIHPASVRTASEALDRELQNDKFFNTEKFPTATFKSTSVKIIGPDRGLVTGDLTLLGVTKPVTLNVRFNKAGIHPMTQDQVAGFSATAMLKRSDFGMDSFIPLVGDDVRLTIEIEGTNVLHKLQKHAAH